MFRFSLLLATLALTACTIDENGNIVMPPPAGQQSEAALNAPATLAPTTRDGVTQTPMASQQQAGTCFAYVTEANGKYTLTSGVGNGTATPMGRTQSGLSAQAVDAAFAHEIEVFKVWPECLGIYATDRSKPRQAAPVAKTAAKTAAPKA